MNYKKIFPVFLLRNELLFSSTPIGAQFVLGLKCCIQQGSRGWQTAAAGRRRLRGNDAQIGRIISKSSDTPAAHRCWAVENTAPHPRSTNPHPRHSHRDALSPTIIISFAGTSCTRTHHTSAKNSACLYRSQLFKMTTTTGDPSPLKSPASLSSGDLVSRYLAATPPYLYNVPLTPHSFFFSEMLRSFVQPKTEPSNLANIPNGSARRRKRSWKEAAPLELTIDKRSRQHHHPHQLAQQHPDKYYRLPQQGQQHSVENITDTRNKAHEYDEPKNMKFDQHDELPKIDEQDFKKNYFADRLPQEQEVEQNVKTEDQEKKNPYSESSKSKLDFSARNFLPTGRGETDLQAVKNYALPGNVQNSSDFMPGPLWYPPYPMAQSYPGIDPLHFFIDLRVSGHIWDQKHGSDRQLPFKGKHSSAFSVPQSKECNRPLNLTRSTSKSEANPRGTHYIMKHITRTYKDIHEAGKVKVQDDEKQIEEERSLKKEETSSGSSQDDDRKDIRAIIGLELVVDYVKEPKCDPTQEQSSTVPE